MKDHTSVECRRFWTIVPRVGRFAGAELGLFTDRENARAHAMCPVHGLGLAPDEFAVIDVPYPTTEERST